MHGGSPFDVCFAKSINMMPRKLRWHGGLAAASCAVLATSGLAGDPEPVRTRVFDVAYAVNESAMPLEAVSLWYTLDRGRNWQEFGYDDDRQSPITFQASQEGHHGFYIMLRNAAGASGGIPLPGTRPQAEVFVDATPPVVQLHSMQPSTSLGRRMLQIRWTAVDANFPARPISISFQRPPDERWYPVTNDPLANTGRFDWAVPETVTGTVAVRVSATDRGGHRVASEPQIIEVAQAQPMQALSGQPSAPSFTPTRFAADTTVVSGSARAKDKAARLYVEAIGLRDRGEYREGIACLRKAVRLDPLRAEAFAEMADMLYRIGDTDRAMGAYELALKQEPTMRAALRGAAMVHRHRNDFASAAQLLRTILRYNPNDAEIWMNLGDVAVYQGDEVMARECYTRATRIDPDATEVVAEAQRRLDLMAQASRNFLPAGN